jgi:hypothetical protein
MAGNMSELMIMMPAFYLMGQIDFGKEENKMAARIGYGLVNVLAICVYSYIWTAIEGRPDKRKIKVPAPASFGQAAKEPEEMTVQDYDKSQLKKAFTSILMGVAIVSFLHFKYEIMQPIFLQCIMTPLQLYKNPLVKIFVLGQKGAVEQRPFKDENPLAALMGGAQPNSDPAPETSSEREEEVAKRIAEADDEKKEKKKSDQQKKRKDD